MWSLRELEAESTSSGVRNTSSTQTLLGAISSNNVHVHVCIQCKDKNVNIH